MILFMAVGLIVPNFEYHNSIVINATPEKCWKAYHDTSTMKLWIEGFKSLNLKQGDALKEGAVYEIIIVQDEPMIMAQQIKEIKESQKISYELTNDVLKSEYSYYFDGDSHQTKVSTHYKVTGRNVFMKAILFFSRSYLKNSDQQMLESLKKVVESH